MVEGQYYLQVCTLLKCQTTDLRTCGEPAGSAFTKFEEFSLSGTFGTSYVFPQIILSESQLVPERHYESDVVREGFWAGTNSALKLILCFL
ncbi:vascular non-inflammatory molecule 3-like [Sagmatias obliquidens]|uniref:vascular non-inflammatory molecule 3-like n=1 Tax=Sagmatias obliquidens TaxID=3371155 RepID=UPI000F44397C|nr:vascular non-inflammatory molecule 3-like [Lagenorhynchus obliquidens]